METLHDHLYRGPIVGIGFSGQAGSAFPVLSILHIIQEKAKNEGRATDAIYAFDPQANPKLAPIIERVAQNYGITTTHIREVPISQYREGVDSGHLFFHGLKPDLDPYIESELDLFQEVQPSLIFSLLRPTLYFSRALHYHYTRNYVPYVAFGYGLLLGSMGHYGLPANFVPFLPKPLERLLSGNAVIAFIANRILDYKRLEARRYLKKFMSRTYWSDPFPPFSRALLGDVTLIPASPAFIPDGIPEHGYALGLVDIDPALSPQQQAKQNRILQQIDQWKAQGKLVIFVAMGTSGEAFPLVIQTLASLLQKFPHLRLVIATTILGHSAETQTVLQKLQSDGQAVIHTWFDLHRLLPKIDLVVNHGGLNTLEFAMRYNIPSFIIAPQQAEQGLNALMLHQQGYGEVVWGHRLEEVPATFAKMLQTLPAYRTRIARHRKRYADYYDPERQREKITRAVNEAFQLAPQD